MLPPPTRKPIVVLTHRRSGTHLMIDLLRRQFDACDSWKWWGEGNSRMYLSLDALWDPHARPAVSATVAARVLRRCDRPLLKTHEFFPGLEPQPLSTTVRPDAAWRRWLTRDAQVVYVYRDGRDALASLQLLEAKRDPATWCPHGEFLRQQIDGMSRPRFWARHVEAGLSLPGVIAVCFEELLAEPRRQLELLGGRLGLAPRNREPVLPRRFASIWASRRARLFATRPESSAILGRPADFPPFDWREVYGADDRAFFHAEAGDVLVRLGYERSSAWCEGPARTVIS